ncbi:DUF3558 domain-containing protein [Rhodococcus sp. HNM0569]|uniref:DUF3558 domain-containing protein n=1 Tax=Rhodococcus sp. HNM0569 TaxID=2716340 RepID=UPI00146ED842|nr:DUF3558 domain-containing protein [Rhodococcus sp. HNM0569]NLU84612.1 DUF3558 domain-containing protein [Rhodococcus sp. HNM0569]
MRRQDTVLALLVFGALWTGATACGSPDIDESAAPAVTAERTPRATDKSGRPQVNFDPCLDLPDEALREAGYDPADADEDSFSPDEYTFLDCTWTSFDGRYGLNVLSGNITWEEQREKVKDYSTPITVGSRPALLDEDPAAPEACAIAFPSDIGVVIASRTVVWGDGEEAPKEEWCKGLDQTAAIIERYVPQGG